MKSFSKKTGIKILFLGIFLSFSSTILAEPGCISCHAGIEKIRDDASGMMALVKALGSGHGGPDGCIMCHGGDPTASDKNKAHTGSPESLIAEKDQRIFTPPRERWISIK